MYKGNYKGPQKFNDGRNAGGNSRKDARPAAPQQAVPQRKAAPVITSIAGKEAEEVFPMRANKFLASRGQGSRRDVDRMISQGQIFINGKRAVLGDKVNEDDVIEFKYRGKL